MQTAETVVALPLARDVMRRVARAHVRQGTPMQFGLFPELVDQCAYERAYHEHARQAEAEIAECA